MFSLIDDFYCRPFIDFPKPEVYDNGFKLKDGAYVFEVTLDKRVKIEDINIDVEGNVVTVTYKYADKDSRFSAASSETLPEDADMANVEAELDNNTLTVKVPQVPQKKTPKHIDINYKK